LLRITDLPGVEKVNEEEGIRMTDNFDVFNGLNENVIHQDLEMRITWANRAACDSAGLDLEQIIGRHCYEIWHKRDSVCDNCPVRKAMSSGQPEHAVMQRPDGSTWSLGGYPLRDKENSITGAMEITYEISELVSVEDELRQSRELYQTVFESATDAFLILDTNLDIIDVNPSACNLYGYTCGEMHGMPLKDIVHPDRRCVVEDLLGRDPESRMVECECRHIAKDNHTIDIDVRATPFKIDDQHHLLLAVRDITEKNQIEKDRRAYEAQMRNDQKLRSIGELAAGIAHEINTPTQYVGDNTRFLQDSFGELSTVIDACRELLPAVKSGTVTDELVEKVEKAITETDLDFLADEIPQAITQSLEGIERVANIVRAMKEFSHPGGDNKIPIDINKAIENTITIARNEWKYVSDVELDLDESGPYINGYPADLNQALLNLVTNAAHAIGEKLGEDSTEKGKITISTHKNNERVEIRINDTGTGIPEEIRDRVFEPFFTTKPVGKGTGQGLMITYDVVVNKHSGKLTFDSEVGVGTTFILEFPMGEESACTDEAESAIQSQA
jgi:PAS domain S-box-containing protein